jgi:hypothetical protein
MWVYQFGYLEGDRPVWINPLWFWECHPDMPQGSPRTRPASFRAAEVSASPPLLGCPAAA